MKLSRDRVVKYYICRFVAVGQVSGADEDSLSTQLKLNIPKSMLLYSQKQWKLFLESATDVLFGHIPMVFEDYMQKSKLCIVQ